MKSHLTGIMRLLIISLFSLGFGFILCTEAPAQGNQDDEIIPTLGLDQGFMEFDTPHFTLKLVEASQTVAALEPKGAGGFDFSPSDRLEQRNGNNFYHIGDLNLRLREGTTGEWKRYSTASQRQPVQTLSDTESILSAADLAATLPDDIPLQVNRYWEIDDGNLVLRFELTNESSQPVEIGSLGIPIIFNNNHSRKSLEEAHAENSFFDPYIGQDAGYLQVTRYNGHGPALLVVPHEETTFEAYRPLLDDRTQRGITFEGFYEWMVHSKAYTENEWSAAQPFAGSLIGFGRLITARMYQDKYQEKNYT